MTIGAIGVMLVMIEKVGALADPSKDRIAGVADEIAQQALRQDGLLLAQLLSTDALDSRAAGGNFRPGPPRGGPKSRRNRPGSAVREFTEIVDFYLSETGRRMVILGGPGTGKTVLAVSLTVGLLRRRTATVTNEAKTMVPCLLNLPSWNPDHDDLTNWLETQISDRFRLTRKIAARLITDGWIIPILDGLDEMDSQGAAAPSRSQSAVLRINDYIARTPDSQIVVVCRSGTRYYDRLARRVRNAVEITVENLKPAQIIDYIKTQCPDERSRSSWRPVFDALRSRDSGLILSELDTPWRLTSAVTFALNGGNPATLLPDPDEQTGSTWHARYSSRISSILMGTFIGTRISIHGKRTSSSVETTIAQLRLVADLLTRSENLGGGGTEIVLHQWWKTFDERKILRRQMLAEWVILHFPLGVLLAFMLTPLSNGHRLTSGGIFVVLMNYVTISYYCIIIRTAKAKGPSVFSIDSLREPKVAGLTALAIAISWLLAVPAAMLRVIHKIINFKLIKP